MNGFLVFVGGGMGALLRYGLTFLNPRLGTGFPWGTFWTNLSSMAILGALFFVFRNQLSERWFLVLGVGFCGGFSTYSTWGMETFALLQEGKIGLALIYIVSTLLLGLILVWMLWNWGASRSV